MRIGGRLIDVSDRMKYLGLFSMIGSTSEDKSTAFLIMPNDSILPIGSCLD